jgi:hypothetical protein
MFDHLSSYILFVFVGRIPCAPVHMNWLSYRRFPLVGHLTAGSCFYFASPLVEPGYPCEPPELVRIFSIVSSDTHWIS